MEWDQRLSDLRQQITDQINGLGEQHSQQMFTLREYLQNNLAMRFRPSPDLLNLQMIEGKLSKQKNYTECEKVRKTAKQLKRKEEAKFLRGHQQKIETQCVHMEGKQKLEM